MALIECFECKNQISDQAKTCPHCGAKTKKKHPVVIVLVLLAGVFAFSSVYFAFSSVYHAANTITDLYDGALPARCKKSEEQLLQLRVKNWLNSEEEIKELGLKCLSVGLVKESLNKYIGLAKFDNGEETHIDVTTDGNRYSMSAKFPLGIPKRKGKNEFQESQLEVQKVKFTKEMYDQIENKMSYSEVVQILGQEGEQISSSGIEGYSTEAYMWQNLDGSNLIIVIQNGIVSMKNQFGLKGEN